jgi:signal transduction histidine kinase
VVARHPGGAAYLGREATHDIKDHFQRKAEGAFQSINLDGVAVEGYFSKTTQNWAYLVASPVGPLWAGVPDAVLKVVLGALVLLAVAGLAALWVARSIAGAVVSLKDAAQRLQAGGPVVAGRTGIIECDEVAGTLAESARVIGAARQDLEQQVAAAVERTRLAEQRVAQGQRIAALGRLTGGVAHDFNNLLGVISNSAHLIERHANTPELQRPLAATRRAVEAGSQLSRQLLRFGGHQPMRPQTVHLAQYLPELRGLLEIVVHRHIQLSFSVQPGTLPVNVDASELELALTNLALNARDAMPNGGHLWMQARNATADEAEGLAPGAYVLVAVTDDGIGMDEAVAARVFEPFFTTKDVGEGTGLGLSQVHGFCEQAGGTARVASTPGLGSTVSLLLPASAARDAAAPAGSRRSQAPTTQAVAALQGIRVLLVEDNEELAEVTALLLESFGCQVRRARHVADALAQHASDPAIDLVLTDVVMPGERDGVALARTLRQRQPQLPVVIISGYSASLGGLTEFPVLRKPVSAEQLAAALVAALPPGPQPGTATHAGAA